MTASGERNLDRLLATMEPTLRDERFVFCTLTGSEQQRYPTIASACIEFEPISIFHETEGLTLVILEERAEAANLSMVSSAYRCITLTVHSSLEAVGLTAAVAEQLAKRGISANVIAAYYHDHIFVPANRADDAVQALIELQQQTEASLSATNN